MARLTTTVFALFTLLLQTLHSSNAWSTKYPTCNTFADCDPESNEYLAKEGLGRGGFFCARTCNTGSDDCWLNSVNDPDICQDCLPILDMSTTGYCQPCCRCWDPRVDLSQPDTEAALSCVDVCSGQNIQKLPLEWDSCAVLMGGGRRGAGKAEWTAALAVAVVGAAIFVR